MSNVILENILLRKSLSADPYYRTYINTDNSLNVKRIDNNTVLFNITSDGNILANSFTNISSIPLTDKSKKLATTEFVIDSLLTINNRNYLTNNAFNVNTTGVINTSYPSTAEALYFPDTWFSLNKTLGGDYNSTIESLTVSGVSFPSLRQTVTTACSTDLATGYWHGVSQFTDPVYNTDLANNNLTLSFIFNSNLSGTYAVIFRKCQAQASPFSIGAYSCYVKEITVVANTPTRFTIVIPKEVTSDLFDCFFSLMIGAIGSNSVDSNPTTNNLSASNAQVSTWRRINTLTTENCINWGTTIGNYIEVADLKLELGSIKTTNFKRSYAEEISEMGKTATRGHAVIDANSVSTLHEGYLNRVIIISALTANKTVTMIKQKIFRRPFNDRPVDFMEFYNSTNFTLTITFPTNTTLVSFAGGVTSLTIKSKETLKLVTSNLDVNTWIPISGTASDRILYPFSHRSFLSGKNGYTILPSTDSSGNNLILQYGVNFMRGNAQLDSLVGNDPTDVTDLYKAVKTVTFPIAFPNQVISVVASVGTVDDYIGDANPTNNTNPTQVSEGYMGVFNKQNSYFVACYTQNRGYGNGELTPFNWFAVGN